MGAIQSSINQALGTAAAGVAAVGRTNELIKSNKLAESQNEIAKAQNEAAKAQNEVAQLEAKKELENAKAEFKKNNHQYLAEATINLAPKDYREEITGEEIVDSYLNKLGDKRYAAEDKAFRNLSAAKEAYERVGGDVETPEQKLLLAIAGNNKKEAKRLAKARSRMDMAQKASAALDEEITARENLKFNIQIAQQKIAALQLDKKATELKAKENK